MLRLGLVCMKQAQAPVCLLEERHALYVVFSKAVIWDLQQPYWANKADTINPTLQAIHLRSREMQ